MKTSKGTNYRANNSQTKHYRRSIRLRGYDYSQTGAYFVTVCAKNRENYFGNIVSDETVGAGPPAQ